MTEYNGMNVLNGTYQTAGATSAPTFHEGFVNGNNGVTVLSSAGNFHSNITVSKGSDYGSEADYTISNGSDSITVRADKNSPFDVELDVNGVTNGMSLRLHPSQFSSPSSSTDVHMDLRTDGGGNIGDGTSESSETWAGTGPESLFNAESSGYVGDLSSNEYDQAQPGTNGSSDPHGTNGPANVNIDGPDDNIRGHWRLQIGADNDINNQHEFSITNATANGLDLEDDNVLSVDNSRTAITAIDHAIDEVNRERSYVGSEQNKLQFTMSNLTSNIQSIESSRSSIEDVDFAAEAADLAKNQILAQSGTAMLAQASAISQNILGLLA